MIFLDAERFIEEAIESVVSQTYDAWELILVDDGSTDGSTGIAERYADRCPQRIRYVEHDQHRNLGMSASRNAGIAAARGELVAFLDADDVYRPQKLERQVAALRAQPDAAMVYGATEHWYSWTGSSADVGRDGTRPLGVPQNTLVRPPDLVPLFLRLHGLPPGICSVLVRREAIDAVGGFEDRFRGMFEDQAFLFKLCLSAPVFVQEGSWDRYRKHPGSHTARERGSRGSRAPSEPNRLFLEWLEGYLSDRDLSTHELDRALGYALRPYRHPLLHRLAPTVVARHLHRAKDRLKKRRGR